LKFEKDFEVAGPASSAIDLGAVDPIDNDWHWPRELSANVHFFKLELKDASGKVISQNFYWRGGNNVPRDRCAADDHRQGDRSG
jgi:hypothetical protein